MRKSFLSIIIFLIAISLTGCDPFVYPSGIWICEELGVTVDFTDVGFGKGAVIIDDVIRDITFSINYGGYAEIDYVLDEEIKYDDWERCDNLKCPCTGSRCYTRDRERFLYQGWLNYKGGWFRKRMDSGKGLMFNAYEWNGETEEWVEKGEYLFVLSGDL